MPDSSAQKQTPTTAHTDPVSPVVSSASPAVVPNPPSPDPPPSLPFAKPKPSLVPPAPAPNSPSPKPPVTAHHPQPHHPLPSGTLLPSPGAHFNYRIVGPCCRLFDREELPWPCCRLQWRGKEPSWRRIGRRFVPDVSVKQSPSYSVSILEAGQGSEPVVMTFYHEKLPPEIQSWWYTRRTQPPASPPPAQADGKTDVAR
ncbi:MAG: hypothetical protein ACO4AJ_13800 [Prochlorothrix sp.]